jgi:hypothetical protein
MIPLKISPEMPIASLMDSPFFSSTYEASLLVASLVRGFVQMTRFKIE